MDAKWIRNLTIGAAMLGATACESGGFNDLDPSQRNALIGGAVGAAAGAALADDDATGALLGGAIGAAAGYYTGCQQQGGCFVGGRQVQSDLYYDQAARRRYYVDPQTGRSYWENGEFRG